MIEPAVQHGIVSSILDHSTSMSDRGAIPRKERPDFGQAQPAHDMSEIHGDLASEGRPRRSARCGAELADLDLEHSGHGGIYRPPQLPLGSCQGARAVCRTLAL